MALRDASDAMTLPGGKRVTAAELEPSLEVAREYFQQPGNFEGLRERLTAAGCAEDEVRGRAYAARLLLPLVQTPAPDRPFGFNVGGEFVLADAWLPDSLAGGGGPLELVRRYLAAWGPSTPADFAAWSGLKGAAALFEALGDELLILRDEARHTLYDLTDAPRPDAETPAPVRLLPDFDAVMLGWRDRTRVVPAEVGKRLANRNLQIPPVVLVDGFVMGTWKLERKRKAAVVTITLFGLLEAAETAALESEALALASTFEPEVVADVVFV
jgi:hypothetical protein